MSIEELLTKAEKISNVLEFKKAVENEEPGALYKYGMQLIENGKKTEGLKYLSKAANKASYKYGVQLIENGKKTEELKYLSQAANALYELGKEYYNEKDYDNAEWYWDGAARLKHKLAKKCLEKLYKNELKDKDNSKGPTPMSASRMTAGRNAPSGTWSKW